MLHGEKVMLRATEEADTPRWHELFQAVPLLLMADGDWYPIPRARIEHWFKQGLDERREGEFSIVADGKIIGGCGLHHADRRTGSSAFGIGIYDEAYVGRGYGRDALRVFLDWAFGIQNWRRIWLTTWGLNERAQRAYRGLGFVDEGRLREAVYCDGQYSDEVVMGMLREEWQARRSRGVSNVKG